MGMPVPGFNAGAPGIAGIVPAIPGTPEGIMVGGTLLVFVNPGVPPGTELVCAMPGTTPGMALVVVTPGTTPGITVGGVFVTIPGTELVAPGAPAHTPCNRETNAVPKNRMFFMSGLSLACCNHRAFNN
tara:strand:- start:1028 stop:1414 length:387 start_codon:yes stop_codon:yes gene_type:complete